MSHAELRSLRALAAAICAATALACHAAAPSADHADVTWRIPASVWMDDARFAELTRLFSDNGLSGKLALFTSELHCPLKLAEMERRAALLKVRIEALHKLGRVAGINNLVTLGHFDECISAAEDVPGANRFTNRHGAHGKVQYCPIDSRWRSAYLAPCYRALAATGADFIWTDDDIRLRNHAVPGGGCFCDVCMDSIRAKTGYAGTREGLEEWLSDPAEGMARRKAMLQHNRETLADLYSFLEKAIHGVAPAMDIGVMDSATAYWQGMPYAEVFAALKTPSSNVYWRPGGGFYKDAMPDALLHKANALAAVAANLPAGVCRIEGELENFLYQRVGKSEHFTALEGMLYVALGLNGVAYNVFSTAENEGLDAYAPLVRRLEANNHAYEWIVTAAGRAPCRGVWAGDGERDIYAGAQGGAWLDVQPVGSNFVNSELQTSGLPIAYRFEDAQVFAPSPEAIRVLPAAKIETMLSGGMYLDLSALEALIARGYGADAGFAPGNPMPGDVCERFAGHPLNAGHAGRARNARQRFFHAPKVRNLKPLPGAAPLSCYVDETGADIPGSCAMGVFENARGGRVCVNAYAPWLNTSFRAKRAQLRSVFLWLAKGKLPGVVQGDGRIALWVRGARAAVAFNMSQDAARDVEVELSDAFRDVRMVIPPSVSETPLSGASRNGRRVFRIPEIPPWSLAMLRAVAPEQRPRPVPLANCVVHRADGIRGLPENSLEAALKAWSNGYIPECDVRYTADGKVVAYHDASINGKMFNTCSWDWLKDYDIGSRKGKTWAHVRIPTWDALFASMAGRPERRILADYKDVPPEVTAALARKHGVQGQVYFCTGAASLIHLWKRANPEGKVLMWIWTGMWGDEKKWDITKPEVAAKCEETLAKRLAEFDRPGYPRPDIVQIHVRTDFAKNDDPFAPSSALLRKAFAKFKSLGIEAQVMPWTGGDSVETYRRLWELGPDSFGTDYPEVLGEFISQLRKGGGR